MLLELIAAFAAAFVGAGIAMILRHLSGGAIPRAAIPVFAGFAMILLTIWSEYSCIDITTTGSSFVFLLPPRWTLNLMYRGVVFFRKATQ